MIKILPLLTRAVVFLAPSFFLHAAEISTETVAGRWSAEQANRWYQQQPWLVGCDFTPSTAINQLEMWQADTFDAATIDRELGWAPALA